MNKFTFEITNVFSYHNNLLYMVYRIYIYRLFFFSQIKKELQIIKYFILLTTIV